MPAFLTSKLDAKLVADLEARIDSLSNYRQVEVLPEQARFRLRGTHPNTWHLYTTNNKGFLESYAQARLSNDEIELIVLNDDWTEDFEKLISDLAPQGKDVIFWHHERLGDMTLPPGFIRDRVLLQLSRDISELKSQESPYPIRSFIVGRDEASWLELNASAFAGHPEQGTWTVDDLEQRLNSSWFDPSLFLVMVDGFDFLGFCWVKIEPLHPEKGEIYVIGVSPEQAGKGLGAILLNAGLEAMKRRGVNEAELHVEESNTAARALYTSFGFREVSRNIRYRRKAKH